MSFLNPLGLALAGLAIPILILYMLRLRRKEVRVSSTMLWENLLKDRQANSPWQKLRRNILLLLQLLLLIALVIALARPAIPSSSLAQGSVVLLLDASASMSATDIQPDRFSQGLALAEEVINDLGSDSQLTLIKVGSVPEVLAASEQDKTRLRQALVDLKPELSTADWESALALAAGRASEREATTTIVISDGGIDPESFLPLQSQVIYLPVGSSADNLGISALSVRIKTAESPADISQPELFVRVANFGDKDRTALLQIFRDDTQIQELRMSLAEGGSESVSITGLPNEVAAYRASLVNLQEGLPLDYYPLDDQAYAVFHPPEDKNVLLVTEEQNIFLEQLLGLLPNINPFRITLPETGTVEIPPDPFDIYVFDGVFPAEFSSLPPAELMFLNPSENPFFEVGPDFSPVPSSQKSEHPLVKPVLWENIHIQIARMIPLPNWGDTLVQAGENPLIFIGEVDQRRLAVVAFDLHDSDLPLQTAFPILFSGLFRYLSPAPFSLPPDGVQVNDPISIRSDAQILTIENPSGIRSSAGLIGGQWVYQETREVGFYTLETEENGEIRTDRFAVNLFSNLESDITPRESLPFVTINPVDVNQDMQALNELWPWLAGMALAVLILEWLIYHQGLGGGKPAAARE